MLALAACIALLAGAAYDFGKKFGGYDQSEADGNVQRLGSENAQLKEDAARMSAELAQSQRQAQIDRASVEDLDTQVKSLTNENAGLKEDLAFFETLMPAGAKEGITINRFKVEHDAMPGDYRYKLLVLQTGARAKEFQGRVQFVVNLFQDNKPVVLVLPADETNAKPYQLGFRFYQRVEGTFRVAPEAVIKSVQVRVFETGNTIPKLVQAAGLS